MMTTRQGERMVHALVVLWVGIVLLVLVLR